MTTIIHNVSRVTSAGSSKERAESPVNKTTRLATEDSEPPLGLDGAMDAPSRHPPSISPETETPTHQRQHRSLLDTSGHCATDKRTDDVNSTLYRCLPQL
jgi:hypothetical protein